MNKSRERSVPGGKKVTAGPVKIRGSARATVRCFVAKMATHSRFTRIFAKDDRLSQWSANGDDLASRVQPQQRQLRKTKQPVPGKDTDKAS